MPLNIKFGQRIKVFESGTIIQFNQEPFLFELRGVVDLVSTLQIEVRFLTSVENTETLISFENGGVNHLIINLTNFNNKIGHGNVEPLTIGTLDNKELFLSFRVTSGNENFSRTLEYTFYLGEEVNNG